MRNMLIVGVVALLLFGLSAGLSIYLTSLTRPTDETSAKEKDKGKEKKGKEAEKEKDKDKSDPPTPLVGEVTPKGAEDVALLLARLRQRSLDLQKREEENRKQEQRLQIVMDDVRGERAIIDNLRKQLSAELGKLNEKQGGIEKSSRSLEEQKAAAKKLLDELEKRQLTIQKNEGKNLTQIASISDSMQPDKAARILKQMADGGEIDTAVKILGEMRERRAAAVIAEITDVKLAAQLMEKLRGLKRLPPATSSPSGS